MDEITMIDELKKYSKSFKKNDNRVLIHPYIISNGKYDYNYFINEFDNKYESYMCISNRKKGVCNLFLEEFNSLEEAKNHHERLIATTENKSIKEILDICKSNQ